MTADEIRKIAADADERLKKGPADFSNSKQLIYVELMLKVAKLRIHAEIAAQLAELNTTMRSIETEMTGKDT